METALDVLSRAATMVQDNANEARISSKELPTARWRRERRSRACEYPIIGSGVATAASSVSTSSSLSPAGTPPPGVCAGGLPSPVSAHHHVTGALHSGVPPPMSIMMAAAMRPLCESTNRPTPPPSNSSAAAAAYHHQSGMESPIDMSVSSSTLKHRSSPPPPYRAPLPGSTYASALARPSVITQAPSKRERESERELLANRENDNRSNESISTCDTVIDEHFRRSLGPNYAALFGKKSPGPGTPSLQPNAVAMTTTAVINTPTPTPPPTQPPLALSSSSSSLPQLQPQALVVAHGSTPAALPPYHATVVAPQALISPKPAAVLLSPAAIYAAAAAAAPPPPQIDAPSPHHVEHVMAVDLTPPQQQPLALSTTQRNNTPQPTTPNGDVGGPTTCSLPLSPTNALQTSPPPPAFPAATLRGQTSMEAHSMEASSSRSPVATPQHSPNFLTATPTMVSSSTPPTTTHTATATAGSATPPPIMPAIMRIKTEPGLTATNTPPASPTSTSSPTSITEVTASVDDHFAKALGDTWKKLQENKEVRK
uniref:Transcription cofactor vestigial-like protein 4 n=1 Tax=Bactrocera latifrons TaxID=174628 RepID=A0A0K8WCI1_BACLA